MNPSNRPWKKLHVNFLKDQHFIFSKDHVFTERYENGEFDAASS